MKFISHYCEKKYHISFWSQVISRTSSYIRPPPRSKRVAPAGPAIPKNSAHEIITNFFIFILNSSKNKAEPPDSQGRTAIVNQTSGLIGK